MVAVALAGPSWTRGDSPFSIDAAALVIALDLSESMAGQDLQPNRLQRARGKILALAEARGDAATGIVVFAGTGHTVLPISDDRQVLLHYLDALQVGMLPEEGQATESILPLVEAMLGDAGETLLLVSDGATDCAIDAFRARGSQNDTQVLVWGMGKTEDQQHEDVMRGLSSDALPLQEANLTALAAAAGGAYQRVTADQSDVDKVLHLIDRHYELSEDSLRPWVDHGYILLWPVALLFLLWFRKGWALRW